MAHIICVANQKGGIGKSTTAQALTAGLLMKGHRTLLIDLDAQGNTTYTTRTNNTIYTSYELLTGKSTAIETIIKTEQGDFISSGNGLSKLDLELNTIGKEYKLKEALEPVKKNYDFIILDTPPALGILTVNALTASDSLIIPAQADIYSLQGIGQLIETVNVVRQYCNPDLIINGILLTRHNKRAILSQDMTEMIEDTADQLNTFVYKTMIREGIAVKEAQANRQDLFSYALKSNAAQDYLSFIDELLERLKGECNNG